MNLKQIEQNENEIRAFVNGSLYINTSQFALMFGISRNKARQMLNSCRYIPNGKEKLYNIHGVSVMLAEKSKVNC